ncbi:hypothetical protein KSP40_PGU009812 [Platanthera guangdongensis]|uniref:Knottins-like domain-containing protein n=1 Tax=Platanthera guangdongensis TaxID=2320717 RepID=A0ABR2M062_9ASPA
MEFFKKMLPALVLVLLLLLHLASGMGPEMRAEAARPAEIPGIGEEKRTCESASKHFKGLCVSKRNCGHVCRTEGFPGLAPVAAKNTASINGAEEVKWDGWDGRNPHQVRGGRTGLLGLNFQTLPSLFAKVLMR